MQRTKINIQEIIMNMDSSIDKLMDGISDAKLTKTEAVAITQQLEEVIALAEQLKADVK